MKIGPVGAELFRTDLRTDGETDMTKLIVAFRNTANAPKIGRTRQATDNTIRHIRIACSITKVRKTPSEYVTLIGNIGYANAPQCYVILTLPVLLEIRIDRIQSIYCVSRLSV